MTLSNNYNKLPDYHKTQLAEYVSPNNQRQVFEMIEDILRKEIQDIEEEREDEYNNGFEDGYKSIKEDTLEQILKIDKEQISSFFETFDLYQIKQLQSELELHMKIKGY